MHKSEGGAARLNEGESKWRGGLASEINLRQRMERRLEKEPPGSAVAALWVRLHALVTLRLELVLLFCP